MSPLFLGATLDDGAEAESQVVELLAEGLYGRQLRVGVSFAFDELLADFGRRQTTRQRGGLELFFFKQKTAYEITNVLKEPGQVEFAGLATTSGEVVHTGDAGV